MVVVVDTNCLLASIPPLSKYFWLYEAFKDEKFSWVVSNEILMEYEEKIADKYSQKTADIVLSILSVAPNVIFTTPFFNWNLIAQDPDDNKFVDAAISSNANYLITNDKDFNVLKKVDFPKVEIISLNEFKKNLS